MRSKLFHAVVLCGISLGSGFACSGEDEDRSDADNGKEHHCAPNVAPTGGTSGLDEAAGTTTSGTAGAGAAADSGEAVGCGGWPPTK